MGPEFVPMPGAEGWQQSNPPVLALAPLIAALEAFGAAGMPALRAKSLALTAFARRLIGERLAGRISIVTPAADHERGCQLSLRVAGGAAVGRHAFASLTARGVIGDWREPDVIRLAPAPLYTRFAEVERAVATLAAALPPP
jgi:kynureninase